MEAAMKGILAPIFEEKIICNVKIRQIFKFSKVGNIADSYVTDGAVKKDAKCGLIRDVIIVADTNVATLQGEKD